MKSCNCKSQAYHLRFIHMNEEIALLIAHICLIPDLVDNPVQQKAFTSDSILVEEHVTRTSFSSWSYLFPELGKN